MVRLHRILVAACLIATVGCARGAERPLGDGAGAGDPGVAAAGASGAGAAGNEPTVTERGIGPLRAGMSLAEARAAVGGGLVVHAGADTAACGYVQWRGAPPGVRVMIAGGLIARVDVDTLPVATSVGARVGDSEARVDSLYPGRVAVRPHKYEDGHYLVVTPDRADTTLAIVFETSGGRVTRYRAGRRPMVEYVEGCG